MRSKPSIFSRNSSRVGKAIRLSSETGVWSCFDGGRRMVKWIRSTVGSDFNRSRQVRSPGCGSPETRSTRSRSRTPVTVAMIRLLRSVSSPSRGRRRMSTMLAPPWPISTISGVSSPTGSTWYCGGPPSIDTSTATWRSATAAPCTRAIRRKVTLSPTMPKPGALAASSARSKPPRSPAIRAWTGPGKRSSRSASWIWPSVSNTAPAIWPGATWAAASSSAVRSRVPSSWPDSSGGSSTTRSSSGSAGVESASIPARSRSAASDIWAVRSSRVVDSERSTTRKATFFSPSRSSRLSCGPASASTRMPKATARNAHPGRPRQSASRGPSSTNAASAPIASQSSSGRKVRVKSITAPAFQGRQGRAPGRTCSSRSGRTSPR